MLAGVHRSSARYNPTSRAAAVAADAELLRRLRQIRDAHPRFGVPRGFALLQAQGRAVNHKRVERLWRVAGFQVPRRKRRVWKRPMVEPRAQVPCVAERPNHVWTYDFIEDGLLDGRRLRILNILYEFTREWLAVKVGASMSGRAVVSVLWLLFVQRGAPAFVRSDNGGEFVASEVRYVPASVRRWTDHEHSHQGLLNMERVTSPLRGLHTIPIAKCENGTLTTPAGSTYNPSTLRP
jgi:transposase InsO family protein